MQLQDSVIIITGGGQGLGRAMALRVGFDFNGWTPEKKKQAFGPTFQGFQVCGVWGIPVLQSDLLHKVAGQGNETLESGRFQISY